MAALRQMRFKKQFPQMMVNGLYRLAVVTCLAIEKNVSWAIESFFTGEKILFSTSVPVNYDYKKKPYHKENVFRSVTKISIVYGPRY